MSEIGIPYLHITSKQKVLQGLKWGNYLPRLRSSNFISKSNPKCNPKQDEEHKTLSFKTKNQYMNFRR